MVQPAYPFDIEKANDLERLLEIAVAKGDKEMAIKIDREMQAMEQEVAGISTARPVEEGLKESTKPIGSPTGVVNPFVGRYGVGENAPESIAGSNKEMEDLLKSAPLSKVKAGKLNEIGSAPELGEFSFDALKRSLAANLIYNDAELAIALQKSVPGSRVLQDEEGKAIIEFPSGQYAINKPGLSGQDLAKFATRIAAFTPAGRGLTGIGVNTLTKLGSRAGATEAALQGVESGLGGEFNPGDVAAATAAAPAGQIVGEKVIAPVIRAGTEAVKSAFRGGEAGRKTLQEAITDFAEIDKVPTLGEGTGEGVIQGIETLSSKLLGGGPIRESLNKTSTQMQKRLAEIADDISPVKGDVETGRVVQKGIDDFIIRFQNKSGELWKDLYKKIPKESNVKIDSTVGALRNMLGDDSIAKVLNNPTLKSLADAVDEAIGPVMTKAPKASTALTPKDASYTVGLTGVDKRTVARTLSEATTTKLGSEAVPLRNVITGQPIKKETIEFSELLGLRSMIGRKLSDSDLISDVPKAELKRVYAAITKDVERIAKENDAAGLFKRANTYTRAGHTRVDDFLDRVANKVDLNKVFAAASKGGDGVQSLNAVKRSLKPEEWEAVAANVIRKLGRATSGNQDDLGQAFSVPKFLTDWDKLGQAKKVLFSGSKELNEYSSNLDRVARVANRFKNDIGAMANPSGTGQFMANVGVVSGGAASLASGNMPAFGLIIAGVAANHGAAKLMTNPKFVNWLARGTATKNWPAHIARLSAVAKSQGLEEEVAELTATLEQWSQQASQTTEPQ